MSVDRQLVKGYELRELIGTGGFGSVYLAYQPMVGREVAIKIILPEYANHPDFIRRFEVEAQLVARLEHPHIIPLYDYWREPNSAFLVMRYLRGGSLRERLHQGAWDIETVFTLLDQIAGALVVAHRNGVVHRDLKPDNILLDDDNNAYLADFGIAKDLGSREETEKEQGAIIGSPAYLSPEQVMGEDVTIQADIYSLGIILYELLGGQHPFPDANTATMLLKHIQEDVPSILEIQPGIPPGVDEVIQRATAKKPTDRYRDARSLASAFRQAIEMAGMADWARMPGAPGHSTPATTRQYNYDAHIENPYKGLRAFEEADSSDFFGRDELIEHLMNRMVEDTPDYRFLAVIGPSGSGKSSVVKAGLIPALRRNHIPGSEDWYIVEMTPGAQPMHELGTALLSIAVNPRADLLDDLNSNETGLLEIANEVLHDDDSELFLYIDQFEEVFTQTEDNALRVHFLNNLLNAISAPHSRVRVVITLRADFYDRPLLYASFGNLVRKRTEVVLPLMPEELAAAISGPAERVGLALEDGLVPAIVSDVGDQVGALPLLQYALTELFSRRQGNVLTVSAYESTGGVLGALARRAEELYTGLEMNEQEAARQLFLRLVTLGEGTEDTRRRILWSEITAIREQLPGVQDVIDTFGKYRLLTFDHDPVTRSPTIEVAHEALIRQWERLRGWLLDSREELRLQRRLTAATEEWLNAGRDRSFLATGVRLAQFEDWSATTDLVMNETESEYLRASIAQREEQQRRELERIQHEEALERRSRNFLRALVVVMFFASVIAVVLMVAALQQRQVAEEQRAIAEQNASEAHSLALAANARNALIEHQPSLALALALEAYNAQQPPLAETQQILARTAYAPGARQRYSGHDGSVLAAVFLPDGERAISGGADGTLQLWDYRSGETLRVFEGHTGAVNGLAVSPDGRYALSASTDTSVRLWDIESGEEIRRFGTDGVAHNSAVSAVAFSPDGTLAVSGGYDTNVIIWDVATGEEVNRFEGHEGAVLAVAFSPDGRYVASSAADESAADIADDFQDRTVRVWDVAETDPDRQQVRLFDPQSGFVRTVAFSPDGRYLVSGSWDATAGGTLQLWDLQDTEQSDPVRRFYGHSDVVMSVVFTADSQRLISGAWDQTIRIWNVSNGTELDRFLGPEDHILNVALSPDEQYVLASVGNIDDLRATDGSPAEADVWVWDLSSRAQIRLFDDHSDWVWSVDLSPDGRYMVSSAGPIRPSPTAGDDYSVRLWDLDSGDEVIRIDEHESTVNWVDYSEDGQYVLSGSWDGTARLWQVDPAAGSYQEAGRFEVGGQVLVAVFVPGGQYILTGGNCAERDDSNTCIRADIILWDIASGEAVTTFAGHSNSINAIAVSADGSTFVSASADRTLRLWDIASGETVRVFSGHTDGVNNVAFSPDGSQTLSSSWDSTVRLWDVESGAEIRRFVGHSGSTWGVAFTRDGQNVLTGGSDTTIRLWSIATGEEIRRFDGHTSWVLSLAVSPEGDFFVSGAEDDTARQWRLARTTEELIAWARDNRFIHEMTPAERELYRLDDATESAASE